MDLISEIMGFDPSNLDAFKEKGSVQDPNIYKTNPKNSKDEDGIYRAKVKILLNPFSPKDTLVPQAQYWLSSMDGAMPVRSSLSIGDKNCPIFKAWKRQWFAVKQPGPEQDAKRAFAKEVFQKNESMWCLVQILEDNNQPEQVGQFRVMKLAKDIQEKLGALTNPSAASKKSPYPVTDYVVGLVLELEVKPGPDDPSAPERKQREISYSLCQFGDYAPIIQTNGEPLLTEDEMELVDQYVTAARDMENGKTAKKKEDAAKKVAELRPELRPIYAKTIAYVQENLKNATTGEALDPVKYCGYQPWDERTTEFVNKWIEIVDAGINPSNMSYDQFKKSQVVTEAPVATVAPTEAEPVAAAAPEEDDGLPF